MGGYNSGRRDGKRTTSEMRTLDVREMLRYGQLQAGRWLSWNWSQWGQVVATLEIKVETDSVMLHYRRKAGDTWQPVINQPVPLAWTPCHYGGQRAWWLCPAVGCGRRVAVLYAGSVFACRHCQQLAYESQRESADDRTTRKGNKLRARLGWKPGIFNGPAGRPKGMHQKTFDQLQHHHDTHAMRILEGIWARLGRQPPAP